MATILNGKIGPHAQGISYNRQNLLPLMIDMGGRYATIVNDWELCAMWLQSGGIPILRIKTHQFWDDDADKNIPDPEAYADHVCNLLDLAEAPLPQEFKGKGIGHHGNELFTGLPERTDPWLAKGIYRYARRGRLCVVGNWAYKNRPQLAKMPQTVRALLETGSFMGYHEGLYTDAPTATGAIANEAVGGFREEQAKFGYFNAMITEFAASLTAHDGWQAMFKNDPRGAAQAWAYELEQCLAVLQGVRGITLYSMPVWDQGRDFKYDDPDPQSSEGVFRRLVNEINRRHPVSQTTPVVIPDYSKHDWGTRIDGAKVVATANSNIRPQPDESATPVSGTLKNGDTVTYWSKPFPGRNHSWVKVLFNGQERYVALGTHLKFENPAPQPGPDLPPGSVVLTPAQYQALQGIHAALGTFIEEVAPALPPSGFPDD